MPLRVAPYLMTIEFSDIAPIVGWAASILSTLIVTLCTALINRRVEESKREADRRYELREQERNEEKRWRESVDERLLSQAEWNEDRSNWYSWRERIEKEFSEQNQRTMAILELQCSQMRSDLIHRAHRYIDDLGCASMEEKDVYWAQYEDYLKMCDASEIENHFIDRLATQVMNLPTREL